MLWCVFMHVSVTKIHRHKIYLKMRCILQGTLISNRINCETASPSLSSPPSSLISSQLCCEHAQKRLFGMDMSNLRFLCDNSARTQPDTSIMSTHTGHGTVAASSNCIGNGSSKSNGSSNGNSIFNCNGNSCGNYIKTLAS